METVRPKYTAIAQRDGSWWVIRVPDVSDIFTQARRLDRVESVARDAISLMLEVPADSFDVDVVERLDPPTQEAIDDVVAARAAVAALKRSAGNKTRDIVLSLHQSGYPQRDIGRLVGISHQRVAQLLATASEASDASASSAGHRGLRPSRGQIVHGRPATSR